MNFIESYIKNCQQTIANLDKTAIEKAIVLLSQLQKNQGRLFILGVGGSSANASHAVNDFRKLCHIEAYAPTDNMGEITARTNDDGFNHIFIEYLKCSKLNENDMLLILSVGGGSKRMKLSENLIYAIDYANNIGAKSIAIVGKDDGYAAKKVSVPIVTQVSDVDLVTPISEAMQALIWHGMVSDKRLQKELTTWTLKDKTSQYDLSQE